MSALSKVLGTAARVANPFSLASGAAYAATGGKVGSDLTPGYSASNVLKTQAPKLITGGQSIPTYQAPGGRTDISANMAGISPISHQYHLPAAQGGAGGAGGSGAAADPYADLRNQTVARIHAIQQAYDALTGGLNSAYADQANHVNQSYDTQGKQLQTAYEDTANQLTGNYQNRGLGDSSFAGNAQDTANQTYQTNLQGLNNDRNNSLATLGQALQGGQAKYAAGKAQYDDSLNQIGGLGGTDLQTLFSNLGSQQSQLAQDQASQGTQDQYLNTIKGVTPALNQGTSQLASQLQQLVNSSTPGFAKNTIANGLISQATANDPNGGDYWSNYFKQLTTGGQ